MFSDIIKIFQRKKNKHIKFVFLFKNVIAKKLCMLYNQIMARKIRKKKTAFSWAEFVVDIIIYPVLILAFFSSFMMMAAKSENIASPIFGRTIVRVLSGSMDFCNPTVGTKIGKGELTMLDTTTKNYKVGDVVAFYYFYDGEDNLQQFNLTEYELVDNDDNKDTPKQAYFKQADGEFKCSTEAVAYDEDLYNLITSTNAGEQFIYNGGLYTKEAKSTNRTDIKTAAKKASVYFHQIVQIKVDLSGTIFYQTKGTANDAIDGFMIRQDFVVGKYVKIPTFISSVINFCSSTTGMLVLVVAPISIIVLIELLSIVEQINNILLEKKVIDRAMPFDSPESIKASIGLEMREPDKIYYYDVMPSEFKMDLYDFLWGCLSGTEDKKQLNVFDTSKVAVSMYNDKDTNNYYTAWIESFKSNRIKKQIQKAQEKANNDRYIDVVEKEYQNYEKDELQLKLESLQQILGKEKLSKDDKKSIQKTKDVSIESIEDAIKTSKDIEKTLKPVGLNKQETKGKIEVDEKVNNPIIPPKRPKLPKINKQPKIGQEKEVVKPVHKKLPPKIPNKK